MADKNFLSWVGFKGEESDASKTNLAAGSASLERIRELESQLNDLRSRRDITGLSKEEFEILATETAMSIIRTAQQREAKASSSAEKVLNESKKLASSTLEQAEAKAKSLLAQAESRGRKYIEAAESDASDILSKANSEAEEQFLKQALKFQNIETGSLELFQRQSVSIEFRVSHLIQPKMRFLNLDRGLRAPLID
ncbi:MAG: hypothetical protein EBX09_07345 [Actinobacteria bacterium]|nr:hypothetical protein [Actinomycetota bacterium]